MKDEDIAQWLGMSQGHFSKVYRWAREGRKPRRNNGRNIPRNIPSSTVGSTPTKFPSPSSAKADSLHALALKYAFKNELSLFDAEQAVEAAVGKAYWTQGKGAGRFYFTRLDGLTLRITKDSLTVWAPEQEGEPGSMLMLQGLARAEAELVAGAAVPLFRLPVDLKLEPEVIEAHAAFRNDAGAVEAEGRGHKISVPDPRDGKERFRVDRSKGPPEAEFTHSRHALKDSVKYEEMVMDVVEHGAWDALRSLPGLFAEVKDVITEEALQIRRIKQRLDELEVEP